jgi:hypothetical protein
MNTLRNTIAGFLALTCSGTAVSQQVPDRGFRPMIERPAYAQGKGPVVCLDEAHHNFHTLENRFWAFGELLRRDGYVVRANRAKFDRAALRQCAVLVISNAQPSDEEWDQYRYPTPSAFTLQEVDAVRAGVEGGGKLLLIADHMPLAGAASTLAATFGVTFNDGFAVAGYTGEAGRDSSFARQTIFRLSDNTLRSSAIVKGRDSSETVTSVRSFTGQAFLAPASAEPVLVLPANFISLMPEKAWQFDKDTRRIPAGGRLQGAVMKVGSGRAAFFGEAAMFSAQLGGPQRRPMGMNAPGAEQNYQLVLNVMHWLSGLIQ